MKITMIKKAIFLVLLLCASCAKNQAKYEEELKNLTIKSALNDEFFEQNRKLFHDQEQKTVIWSDSQKNVVKSYSYSKRKLGPLSYIFFLSFLLPRNYENYEFIITLNKGTIVDIKEFHGILTLSSEAICHEAIFSCVIDIK